MPNKGLQLRRPMYGKYGLVSNGCSLVSGSQCLMVGQGWSKITDGWVMGTNQQCPQLLLIGFTGWHRWHSQEGLAVSWPNWEQALHKNSHGYPGASAQRSYIQTLILTSL